MSTPQPIYTKEDINEKTILAGLKDLADHTKANFTPLSEAGYDENSYIQVKNIPPTQLKAKIEETMLDIYHSIMDGGEQRYVFNITSRSSNYQVYLEDIERYVLVNHEYLRSYTSFPHTTTTVTSKILQIVYDLLCNDFRITERDLFYINVTLFEDQSKSDSVLEDIACMLRCTRNSHNVVAKEGELMIGRIILMEDGDYVDCSKMGKGGKGIPRNVDCIRILESEALFILLVEKDTVFYRLAEERFYNKYPCIIMTASGYPDIGTRRLVDKLYTELNIPVLALTDADPHSIQVLTAYTFGSKNMSYDSLNLATPNIVWLGLKPSDLDGFGIPKASRITMSEDDIQLAKSMKDEKYVTKIPGLFQELGNMITNKEKAELEALNCYGLRYLTQVYLPKKLQEMVLSWISSRDELV